MFENNNEINLSILKTIYKKRKLLIALMVLALVSSIITTTFTPKRYKSEGIVYPVNSNAYNDIIHNPTFGREIDADRLIQLFQSNSVKDSIIKAFDLIRFYQIDTSDKEWQHKLYASYDGDISFSRNRYLSVTISATTKDADLSANIVNRLISLIDVEREKILKTNVKLIVENYEKEYSLKRNEVDRLLSEIYSLTKTGKKINGQNPLFKNRELFMEERQKNTHIFPGDKGVKAISAINQTQEVENLINDYYFMQSRMNFIRGKLDEAQTRLNLPIASVYKISWAKPVYKKVSPSMTLNAIIFMAATLILALLFIIGIDQLKIIKKEIK